MTIKLVLAPLTGGKRDALTLANAFAAAAPLDAHVRALFVRPDPTEALPFFGDEVAPAMAGEIVDAGAFPFILIVQSDRPGLADRLRAAGALLLVNPLGASGCGQRATRNPNV